ncbi:hypothetical protein ADEAN_000104600 [Angomonas deanei]|uniref:Uncharacterized protein n=1 Tax=Angomonas deanei TaxID=59799 RepID=A0A7G2C4E4_9TRYP|nr:hypothetical protein ADEAN_000104600 [Angomonas deanei]
MGNGSSVQDEPELRRTPSYYKKVNGSLNETQRQKIMNRIDEENHSVRRSRSKDNSKIKRKKSQSIIGSVRALDHEQTRFTLDNEVKGGPPRSRRSSQRRRKTNDDDEEEAEDDYPHETQRRMSQSRRSAPLPENSNYPNNNGNMMPNNMMYNNNMNGMNGFMPPQNGFVNSNSPSGWPPMNYNNAANMSPGYPAMGNEIPPNNNFVNPFLYPNGGNPVNVSPSTYPAQMPVQQPEPPQIAPPAPSNTNDDNEDGYYNTPLLGKSGRKRSVSFVGNIRT